MKNLKKLGLLGVMLLLLLSATACGNDEVADNSKTIAEYEGGKVTELEFDNYLSIRKYFNPELETYLADEAFKSEILKQYVAEEYLMGKVEDSKTDEKQSKEILDVYKEKWIQQLGSESKYTDYLKESKITEDDLLEYINRYFLIQDYFTKIEYKENKEEFTVATVSHILILINEERTEEEAKALAEEVLAKAKAGEDFAELAKQYSEDPGSKDNGGTYADMPVSGSVPEFKEATLTLPLNEVSDLVKTDYGYHIIVVSDRSIPEYEDISLQEKDTIYSLKYGEFLTNELPKIMK